MTKWLATALLLFLLVGCNKSADPAGPGKTPGASASGAQPGKLAPPPSGAPVGSPPAPPPGKTGDPKAPMPMPAIKDGPTLAKLMAGAKALVAPPRAGSAGAVGAQTKDAAAIQAVLTAVNLKQTARANFKPCRFVYGFEVRDANNKELSFVTMCLPVEKGKPSRGSVTSRVQKAVWGVSFPDGGELGALLDKYLPEAKGAGG